MHPVCGAHYGGDLAQKDTSFMLGHPTRSSFFFLFLHNALQYEMEY
jgi:hypothetical protein